MGSRTDLDARLTSEDRHLRHCLVCNGLGRHAEAGRRDRTHEKAMRYEKRCRGCGRGARVVSRARTIIWIRRGSEMASAWTLQLLLVASHPGQ